MTIVYVVMMLRNDDCEQHTYLDGVYMTEEKATLEATEHVKMRDGKYGAKIHGYELETNEEVYWKKISSNVGMAYGFKKTAENLRKMIGPTLTPHGDKTCTIPNCSNCALESIKRTVALNEKLEEIGVAPKRDKMDVWTQRMDDPCSELNFPIDDE